MGRGMTLWVCSLSVFIVCVHASHLPRYLPTYDGIWFLQSSGGRCIQVGVGHGTTPVETPSTTLAPTIPARGPELEIQVMNHEAQGCHTAPRVARRAPCLPAGHSRHFPALAALRPPSPPAQVPTYLHRKAATGRSPRDQGTPQGVRSESGLLSGISRL